MTDSKRGGVPYVEREDDWPRHVGGELASFLGQINLAQLPPIVSPAPRRRILALYLTDANDAGCVRRWYPEPRAPEGYRGGTVSLPVVEGPSADAWESRVIASPAYTASFHAWYMEWVARDPDADQHRVAPRPEIEAAWNLMERFPAAPDLAAFTEATSPLPGPRDRHGDVPDDGGSRVQLWKEPIGSSELSVVVRVADFEAGDLHRYRGRGIEAA